MPLKLHYIKNLNNLDSTQLERLRELTFGPAGGMYNQIGSVMKSKDEKKEYRFVLAKHDDYIVGWLLADIMRFENIKIAIVGTFVSPDFRQKGIGRQIIDRAIEELKKEGVQGIRVNIHDDASFKLYNKYNPFKIFYDYWGINI